MTKASKGSKICTTCIQLFQDCFTGPIAFGLCCERKSNHYCHLLHPQHPACKRHQEDLDAQE